MTMAYKVEVLVIDHDGLGEQGIIDEMENVRYPNHCMNPEVKSVVGVDLGEWDDDLPINSRTKSDAEYKRLFGGANEKEEA